MAKMYLAALCLLYCWSASARVEVVLHERDGAERFKVERLTQGLGVPWGLAFLNPSELMFTERGGRAGVLDVNTGHIEWLAGVATVQASGQGGLMDVAVPANYAAGGWIYFTYSKKSRGGAATVLARAKRLPGRLASWQDLLISRSVTGTGQHFGSRIAFDGKGHLFFTVGDRGHRPNAQDLSTHAGSILRLHLDGRVPADNPFNGNSGALPEIWSYGHRNPQGIVYDAHSERLWAIEHGPRGGDEINLIEPGRNYGWPVISHGMEYWGPVAVGEGREKAGMEQPVKVYIPSIAPAGLLLYSGKSFPAWKGNLLAGALALRHLNRVVLDENGKAVAEHRLLASLDSRIRALSESPNGWIYFSTDDGRILRIRP